MSELHKGRVVDAFCAAVGEDLQALAQVTSDARSEATGGESRSEGRYDTRATEASYLAAGQGERLLALRSLATWLAQLDPGVDHTAVGPGALVSLERDGTQEWVLLAPRGGHSVAVDGRVVRLISADAPLGAVLEGLEAGDGEEVVTPRGVQALEVLAVS